MADGSDSVSNEFAKGALAALAEDGITPESPKESGGEPEQVSGEKPAESDPVTQLAAALRAVGATPEVARQALSDLSSLQTVEGQRAYWQRFMNSDAGAEFRAVFGRDYLAQVLASPDGGRKIAALAQQLGSPIDRAEEEDLSPEQRELRETKAQMQALHAKLAQLEQGTAETRQALVARATEEQKQSAFIEWARSKPRLADKAYQVVAKRAHELAQLYPQKYNSNGGFKRAADDAFSELSSVAPAFAPPKAPRGLRSEGGGVTAGKGFDFTKLSLDERIKLAAEDFAQNVSDAEE